MAKITLPPGTPQATHVASPVDEIAALRAQLATARADNARLSNQLAQDKPTREIKASRVQLNLIGERKENGKENTGYVTLFASDDPETGRSRGCANGSVSFWREVVALLADKPSDFARAMLAGIAQHEDNLRP